MLPSFSNIFNIHSSLTTDVILLVVLILLFFFYAVYFGKSRIISLLFAFYPAFLLYQHFPFLTKFIFAHSPKLFVLNEIVIFLVFIIVLDIIINRFVFADSGYGSSSHYLRIFGFALAGVILVMVLTYSVISLDVIYNFSPFIDSLFSGPNNIFWWTIAPLILMFFL